MNADGTRFLAVLAVMAMAFVAFTVVGDDATDGDTDDVLYVAPDVVYLHGEIVDNQSYTTLGTKVVVDQDLLIKNGATLLIGAGVEFHIPADVTVTVNGSNAEYASALVIDTNASVFVEGDIIIGDEGTIVYDESDAILGFRPRPIIVTYAPEEIFRAPHEDFVPLMYVVGSIVVDGGKALLNSTTDDDGTRVMIFGEDGLLDVRSTGTKLACVSGDILLEDGAQVSVVGKICDLNGNDGELDIFAFAGAQAMFIDEYTDEEELIEPVYGAYDVWSYDGATIVYLSEVLIEGDCEWYEGATATDLSRLCIEAFVNDYDAWTIDVDAKDKLIQKEMTVLESNLCISGTLKGGDVIETSSADYKFIPYWSTKSDCEEMNDEFFYAASTAVITAEFSSIPEPTSGMSTMDIVLIVLVILFAIIAVVLALKLRKQTSN